MARTGDRTPGSTVSAAGASGSHADLTGVTASQHHSEDHAARHLPGGADPIVAASPSPAAQNLLGWNYDPAMALNNTVVTAMIGIVQLSRVQAVASGTVGNLYSCVVTIGNTLTNSFMGLYAADGTRLGLSADQSANWVTAGLRASALTAGVPVTAGTFYYVAWLIGAATTAPAFSRTFSGSASAAAYNAGLTAATLRAAASGTGLTALPASITMSSNSIPTSGVVAWVAMGA